MRRLIPLFLLCLAGCNGNGNGFVDVTGQIEAVSVGVGSRVGGRVIEVLVKEGDAVKQGDVLVRLDAAESEAAVAAATARLAQAQATLAKAETGARPEEIQQAEAALARTEEQYRMAETGSRVQEKQGAAAGADAARAQRDEARLEFDRAKKLMDGNAVSQQRYDQAEHALEAAEALYKAASEKQGIVVEGARSEEIGMAKAARDQAQAFLDQLRNGARKEDLDAARALRDAAAADLDRARALLDEMIIKASQDGVVESIDVHPGDLVKPGPVVSVADPEDLELFVYVSSAMLGHLRIGQKIALTTDSHGPEKFEGTIVFIASQGEFTPRNLQTKEDRVQQVFGIKLELHSAGGRLRAGMTATAHLAKDPAKAGTTNAQSATGEK